MIEYILISYAAMFGYFIAKAIYGEAGRGFKMFLLSPIFFPFMVILLLVDVITGVIGWALK